MKGMKLDARSVGIGLVLGSLAGACGGYVLARSRARREYAARLDKAVAEVKAHYKRPVLPVQDKTNVVEIDLDKLVPGRNKWIDVIKETIPEGKEPEPDPLEGIPTGSDDDETDDPDGEGLPAVGAVPEEEPAHPFEISADQFGELADEGFQTISVTFYEADRVLCDDKDDPIRDVKGTIGTDNPRGLNPELSGDPQIRYVRNRRLDSDFEILLDSRAYVEVVLSYGQPNKKREASARTKAAT